MWSLRRLDFCVVVVVVVVVDLCSLRDAGLDEAG